MNVEITLNDGTKHTYPKGTTYYEASKDFQMPLSILGARVNNEVVSMDLPINNNEVVNFFDLTDINGYMIYKSGLKMIFEVALKKLYPDLNVTFEHSVPKGMLARVIGNKSLTQDDILNIKKEMNNIIEQNTIIKKLNVRKKEAINFYNQNKEYEKADNVQNISDKVVTLYNLNGLLNYYYSDMPYSTGVINKYELVYLGNNKIIFLFPSIRNNGNLPEYVHYDNIINCFDDSKHWLDKLNMPYVTDLNRIVGNGKIKEFIKSNEIYFNINIYKAVQDIINNKDIKVVLIAGPSSSGKTTTTKKIATCLASFGYHPVRISIDDYFVNREDTPKDKDGNYDFECMQAIDLELFNSDLNKLLKGEEITLPEFNFIIGKREKTRKIIKLRENSIILIEGLHSLNDELTPNIDKNQKYKIYLSPFIPLNIDRHNYISTMDLRLLRRIVRDNRTRGYTVATTIHNWQSVQKGEEKYIFPYIHQANIIINTALSYEVGVIKVYVEPLLLSVGVDSEYFEEAKRLLKSLKQFFPIPGEYVNDDSILREFIGGGEYD